MNSVVTFSGVAFEWPNGHVLFRHLNFTLNHHRTALVGVNGIGKSALAKLISGEFSASEGSILRHHSVTIFAQEEAPPDLPVADFLAGDGGWSYLREQWSAGIDPTKLCSQLSGGEWMRVRLARVLNEGFLILDEPTNNLDREGRGLLLQFLREHQQGILLISHDRECLELADEVMELSKHGLTKFGGGWNDYAEARAREQTLLESRLNQAKQNREVAKATRTLQRERQDKRNRKGAAASAKGGLPKILAGRRKRAAEVSTGRIDAQSFDRLNETVNEAHSALQKLKTDPLMYADLIGAVLPAQKLVAEAVGFNVHFETWLYPRDLNFAWRGNVRIAIRGGNGTGKSTLIKALLGEAYDHRGELRRGHLQTLYVDQRCQILDEEKTLFENVREVSNLSESEIRNGLAKFLFAKDTVFQKVRELSGGERLRATLARGLLATTKPELLILDEPTNNLDLVNIQFLEQLIGQFRAALILISHDEIFLKNCRIESELIF
jgi:ATPase subunit of ABC transporter with duplicated ATPase domains